jgi:hypothetical protein
MKITWFGGTTLRIHIGGKVLVCDAAGAPPGIDRRELLSGADRDFGLTDELPLIDTAEWQPRRPAALVDEGSRPEVLVHAVGPRSVLIDAVGEPPLLLLSAQVPAHRLARDPVVVAFAGELAETALATLAPRLIALAMDEESTVAAFAKLRDHLHTTALVALEPGMALEI